MVVVTGGWWLASKGGPARTSPIVNEGARRRSDNEPGWRCCAGSELPVQGNKLQGGLWEEDEE